MVVRYIEKINGELYGIVYIGRITRGNGGCVIARCRKTGSSPLYVAGIYKIGEKEKIGEMEIESNDLRNGEITKKLENFLKEIGEIKIIP